MTKRNKLLISYLVVMCLLTFVRICFSESFFGELDDVGADRLFSTLSQIVCMGIVPVVCIACTSSDKSFKGITRRLGFRRVRGAKAIIIVFVIAILHAIINGGVSTVWSYIVKATGYKSVVSDPERYLNVWEFLLGIFFSAILPGLFEEITHRSLAYRMTGGSHIKKTVMSALLFALMHQNILQTGYTFVGGLMFGALVSITGSIYPAILAHFVNNFFVVIRIYSYSNGGLISQAISWINTSSSTVLGGIIFALLWLGCAVLAIFLYTKLMKLVKNEDDFIEEEEESSTDKTLSVVLWIAILIIGISTTAYSYIWGLLR